MSIYHLEVWGFRRTIFFKQNGGADTQFLAMTPQMQAAEAAHMLQQSAAVESFAQYPPQAFIYYFFVDSTVNASLNVGEDKGVI